MAAGIPETSVIFIRVVYSHWPLRRVVWAAVGAALVAAAVGAAPGVDWPHAVSVPVSAPMSAIAAPPITKMFRMDSPHQAIAARASCSHIVLLWQSRFAPALQSPKRASAS